VDIQHLKLEGDIMKKIFVVACFVFYMAIAAYAFSADATLTWTAPTTNSDGSPLTDLAGYTVYYGNASGDYSTIIPVGNVTTYVVTGLGDGTWYFNVTASDTAGNESVFAIECSKTIDTMKPAPPSGFGCFF